MSHALFTFYSIYAEHGIRAFDFHRSSRKERRYSNASNASCDTTTTTDSEFADYAIVDYPTPPPEEDVSDIFFRECDCDLNVSLCRRSLTSQSLDRSSERIGARMSLHMYIDLSLTMCNTHTHLHCSQPRITRRNRVHPRNVVARKLRLFSLTNRTK